MKPRVHLLVGLSLFLKNVGKIHFHGALVYLSRLVGLLGLSVPGEFTQRQYFSPPSIGNDETWMINSW